MTEPNEQQMALMQKYKLNPNNWMVYAETGEKLIIKNRRGMRRELKKEGAA